MSFLGIRFYLFVIIVFALYFFLSRKKQNTLLLLASYFFYACWDWRFIFLLILSTLVDFYCGKMIAHSADGATKKRFLIASIIFNLGVLSFYKYCNFFVDSFYALIAHFGYSGEVWSLNIILPLGISFYTFQTLSYTIDVYRGSIVPATSLRDYALYVAFFPQLVAGPIERGEIFLPQVTNPRRMTVDKIKKGVYLIVWGLFKKLYVGEGCVFLLGPLSNNELFLSANPASIIVSLYAFAIYFYADISGYTDIARGVANCFGFELSQNFRWPYFARNLSDFWRRWHMSVTYWFRDYVYFPVLAKTRGRANLSSFAVLMCISIWHDLSLNSIVRGLYFGLLIVIFHFLSKRFFYSPVMKEKKSVAILSYPFSMLLTFHVVAFGWIFFHDISLINIIRFPGTVFTAFKGELFWRDLLILLHFVWPLFLIEIVQIIKRDEYIVLRAHLFLKFLFYWFVIWGIVGTIGFSTVQNFMYFNF
jgi:D-alanyl-lipoteichoic acid acyltransferase DltB (MBOAT superfamily)